MTAFDGPGPFAGDAVYHYVDQAELPPPAFREAVGDAFGEVIRGGAARHVPAELLAMVGLDRPPTYLDVDEAVWAWACAELVALAIGHQPETPIPDAFARAARTMPEPAGLISDALEALQIVVDPKRSELAGLLKEGSGAGDVWLLGEKPLFHIPDDGTVETMTATFKNSSRQREVWGTSSTDLWITGDYGLLHTVDGGRSWESSRRCIGDPPKGIWGSSPRDLWTACLFGVHRSSDAGATWRGSNFQPQVMNEYVARGSGPNDVWVIGLQEVAYTHDGGATWQLDGPPTSMASPTPNERDLWSAGDGWVWLADTVNGVWVRRGLTEWVLAVRLSRGAMAVWGANRHDVWAVGYRGEILHWK